MPATDAKREGVKWKKANLNGLNKEAKKLWDTYKSDFDRAQAQARLLRQTLNQEWTKLYPSGKDGKVCSFNVINGVVNYAWIKKDNTEEEGEALFP